MKETTNYNLKKIELQDSPPDITVHSGNFDIIDSELKRQDEETIAHKADNAIFQTKKAVIKETKKIVIPANTVGWIRILEHQDNKQIYYGNLNIVTISEHSANGGSGNFVFSSFRANPKVMTKLHSLKLAKGVQKVRIVDPSADWTAGNYIDIYVDVSAYDLNIYVELISRNDMPSALYKMNILDNYILNPEIPVGYRAVEVEL